ncbi:MAG: hypothetical protein ACAH59_07730 [Pseudobdellovibrionaceae bacterium]
MEKNTTSATTKGSPQFGSEAAGASAARTSDVINNVKSKIADQAGPAVEKFQTTFRDVQETAQPYLENAQSYFRRYPLYSVLGAAAIGAVIGMIVARPTNRVSQ